MNSRGNEQEASEGLGLLCALLARALMCSEAFPPFPYLGTNAVWKELSVLSH